MWRPLLMFCVTFAVFAAISGPRLLRPSPHNHFVHMAHGWLDGRLAHKGVPPGFCDPARRRARKCRVHRFDDWARLQTLELADGTRLRASACRTAACAKTRSSQGVETWFVVGQGWRSFPVQERRVVGQTWYVSFPPGPAAVMLPFVAVFGLGTPDVALTAIAGALLPVLLLVFLDRRRGTADGRGAQHVWLALALGLGSPACFLASSGGVWFTAQVFGALFLMAYVASAWDLRRPAWAGLWLGAAIACRPTMAGAGLLVAFEWWRCGRRLGPLIRVAGPLLTVGAALAMLNFARFADPFEFGHRFLEIRWQPRIQEFGLFHPRYLRRNLACMLWLLPERLRPLQLSIHGTALWLGSPWVLLLLFLRGSFPQRLALGCSVVAVAVPALLYQNSGQMQPTYRFAMLWLPLLAVLLAMGGALRRTRLLAALAAWSIAAQGGGAWMFARERSELFVTHPIGWPFEDEFEHSN